MTSGRYLLRHSLVSDQQLKDATAAPPDGLEKPSSDALTALPKALVARLEVFPFGLTSEVRLFFEQRLC